jgi:S1-C subfamily serine protease
MYSRGLFHIIMVVALWGVPITCLAQSFTINNQSFGLILEDNVPVATGFSAMTDHTVITCAHVVKEGSKYRYHTINGLTYELKLSQIDNDRDIAILTSDTILCTDPLIIDDDFHFRPDTEIVYMGLDNRYEKRTILAQRASLDIDNYHGVPFSDSDFFIFYGDGRPGYSGSPVLTLQGKLIGMISGGKDESGSTLVRCVSWNTLKMYFLK